MDPYGFLWVPIDFNGFLCFEGFRVFEGLGYMQPFRRNEEDEAWVRQWPFSPVDMSQALRITG